MFSSLNCTHRSLSSVILCFHLSLVCAHSRVFTARFIGTMYSSLPVTLGAPSLMCSSPAVTFTVTVPLLADPVSHCSEFADIRRICLSLHYSYTTRPYSSIVDILSLSFVDRRPPLTLISSFVDLSVLFGRRRMWQSTRYSPRYLLVDPHTYSSKSSFVVLLLVLENILF